jgi:hypothetical protein
MKTKINFNLQDLSEALEVVSIVTPSPVTQSGGAGYLFVVKGLECFLYSRNIQCVSRAKFPLIESSGGASFAFPSEYLGALRFLLAEGTCEIEATADDGRYIVEYHTPNGAESEFGSFDPSLLATCDEDFEKAQTKHVFCASILHEAVGLARPFIADLKNGKSENLKGIEVIDQARLPNGDGYLYAADGNRAFYFYTEEFKGKSLEIHGQHVPAFLSFLAKCEDEVTICKGKHFTFAVNTKGDVFGWPEHDKLHDKFNYYTTKKDPIAVSANRAALLNTLQHARACMAKDKDRIKVNFNPSPREMRFSFPESKTRTLAVKVNYKFNESDEEAVEPQAYTIGVNVDFFIELVQTIKGHDAEIRWVISPPTATRKNEVGLFRTIDEFRLDTKTGKVTPEPEGSIPCRVTRFMPSRE